VFNYGDVGARVRAVAEGNGTCTRSQRNVPTIQARTVFTVRAVL